MTLAIGVEPPHSRPLPAAVNAEAGHGGSGKAALEVQALQGKGENGFMRLWRGLLVHGSLAHSGNGSGLVFIEFRPLEHGPVR